ncbi:hypothetical protein JB92DRAFT_2925360 [Gautieria morchelliformis]|nr:hypothetical protein JB92DRAFT_2925360 [Gautieria morchelliformis]
MRIARSFSTFLWWSRQALYEPYVAPLNEEQKKALRKLMAKDLPNYNSRLNKDIPQLLQAYQPSQSTFLRRKQTIEHVEHIIRTAYGPEYSIIDRSLYTYARDVEASPLEFAIYDASRPKGFLPGTEDQPLPDPYNHEALAELFKKYGFTGCFIAGDAERTLPADAPQLTSLLPVNKRGDIPVNPPWPSFTPRPVPYLTYPPVLYAQHVTDATLPFFLSPPMPTHLPLLRLLRAYCSINGSYADFISLILLWVRSIDLPQLTPTCIALMVIGYLQVRKSVPSLQNPRDPEEVKRLAEQDEGVWVRAEWRPRYPPKAFWMETAFMAPRVNEAMSTTDIPNSAESRTSWEKKLGPILLDFFQFWSRGEPNTDFISNEHTLSVREGRATPRVSAAKAIKVVIRKDETNENMIQQGSSPWAPTSEPIMWQTHPIAVPDPFMPSYNHAQSLSKSAGSYFHYFCSLSHRTLSRGHTLATVMGPHLSLPRGGIRSNSPRSSRAYSTGRIGDQATELYESMLPQPDVLAARMQTISRVQKVIKDKFGAAYFVESFGSTRYGVSSATSDLDLVIMDPRFQTGFHPKNRPSQLPAVYDVKQVARMLSKSGFNQVLPIPKATVPIVKFRDPATGLECDLNTNDRLGLWNTRLISTYCDLHSDLVRPMIMIIKRWAKSHGLNDPSGRSGPVTFSSYALVLMVIGFLQVKGVLPNLQAGLEPLSKDANQNVFWVWKRKRDPVRCDIRFSENDWQTGTHMELGEALEGWFMFWASEYDYSKHVLSIREGGLVMRASPPKKKRDKKERTKKTGAIPVLDQLLINGEREEEAALAAWRSQNASEQEKAELERVGTPLEEAFEGFAAESQTASEGDDAVNSDHRSHDPPGHQTQSQAQATKQVPSQPSVWPTHTLIVADPFILDKNVCSQIVKKSIERFKEECQRSCATLTSGGNLVDLMGKGHSLPGAVRRRGNRRNFLADSNRGKKEDKGKGRIMG